MLADPLAETQRAIRLEARNHYLLTSMLSDPEFIAGIERGRQEIEVGEFITLAELKSELGRI